MKECVVCPYAKMTRLSCPSSTNKSVACFDLLHLDLWGHQNTTTIDGTRYFLTVVDDYSRLTRNFLKTQVRCMCCVA